MEFLEHEIFDYNCEKWKHFPSKFSEDTKTMLRENMPWVIKQFPQRYPFLTAHNRHQQQIDWINEKCNSTIVSV